MNKSFALWIAVGLAWGLPPSLGATSTEDAGKEYDAAIQLTPNVENGRRVYLTCAVCCALRRYAVVVVLDDGDAKVESGGRCLLDPFLFRESLLCSMRVLRVTRVVRQNVEVDAIRQPGIYRPFA